MVIKFSLRVRLTGANGAGTTGRGRARYVRRRRKSHRSFSLLKGHVAPLTSPEAPLYRRDHLTLKLRFTLVAA